MIISRTGRAPRSAQTSHDRLREAAKVLFAKHGYEATSTAAICRAAGTSQSQLIKHFTSKQGLLEAIFQHAWDQINPAIRLAIARVPSPKEKLRIFANMVLNLLERDRGLRTLFLLEGRRIRGDGEFIVLVPGYLDFVRLLDGILKEMAGKRQLAPGTHPQALRSALIGAVEGMLRDRLLARPPRFPASYSEEDIRRIFSALVLALVSRGASRKESARRGAHHRGSL
jgi:TetR/AcrR family transcriptional regulator, repressor for uid operon